MRPVTVAAKIASLLQAIANCESTNNHEWKQNHSLNLNALCREALPSGGGIDNGTTLDRGKSSPARLVLLCDFHHMDGNGVYDGWTHHTVIVTPAFDGLDIRITGRNRNQIKDYLHGVYSVALSEMVGQETRWNLPTKQES